MRWIKFLDVFPLAALVVSVGPSAGLCKSGSFDEHNRV